MNNTPAYKHIESLAAPREEIFYSDGEVWVTDQRIVYTNMDKEKATNVKNEIDAAIEYGERVPGQ